MRSKYSLTENQKKLARCIVQNIQDGHLGEEFKIVWDEAKTVIRGPKCENSDGNIVTRGNVQGLCEADLLRVVLENKNGVRLMVIRKPVCLLKDKTLKTLHTDLVGKLYREFDPQDPEETIPGEISKWLAARGIS